MTSETREASILTRERLLKAYSGLAIGSEEGERGEGRGKGGGGKEEGGRK